MGEKTVKKWDKMFRKYYWTECASLVHTPASTGCQVPLALRALPGCGTRLSVPCWTLWGLPRRLLGWI